MKKYIDCDGVILNTEDGLFDNYYELKKINPELKKRQYLQEMDWIKWLNQATILNDAIEILKNYNPNDADILTRVHSLKEAKVKIEYFRERKVENNIIIVPDGIQKSSVVTAKGNMLVDDSNNNLTDWEMNNGISFYFGSSDSKYQKISSLDDILNPDKVIKLLRK